MSTEQLAKKITYGSGLLIRNKLVVKLDKTRAFSVDEAALRSLLRGLGPAAPRVGSSGCARAISFLSACCSWSASMFVLWLLARKAPSSRLLVFDMVWMGTIAAEATIDVIRGTSSLPWLLFVAFVGHGIWLSYRDYSRLLALEESVA